MQDSQKDKENEKDNNKDNDNNSKDRDKEGSKKGPKKRGIGKNSVISFLLEFWICLISTKYISNIF